MRFSQYKLGHYLPCLMGTKVDAYEASGYKEYDTNISLCYSVVQTQDTLGRIHNRPWATF